MSPLVWALAASVAANLALGGAWLSARDDAAVLETQRDQARGDASACSDATEALRELADKRKKDADGLREEARKKAAVRQRNAQTTLSTLPSNPQDQCASIKTLADDWIRRRNAP